jgi:hypothetical protein
MTIKASPILGCFLIALGSILSADYIKLKSGDAAKIKINDTAGC